LKVGLNSQAKQIGSLGSALPDWGHNNVDHSRLRSRAPIVQPLLLQKITDHPDPAKFVAQQSIPQRIAASQPALLRLVVLQTRPLQSTILRLEVIDGTRLRALRGAIEVKNGVKSGGFWQPLSQDVALCWIVTTEKWRHSGCLRKSVDRALDVHCGRSLC
jgi:hypothetical protein